MTLRADSERLTATTLSRLTDVVRRIHVAGSVAEGLTLLVEAARDVVGAGQVSARSEGDGEAPAGSARFPLVTDRGESFGALVVAPLERAEFTEAELTVLAELARLGAWALESSRFRQLFLEQGERLRLALDAANLGTWEHVPSSRATYWDERSKVIFGRAPDQAFEFEHYMAALHPDDVASLFAGIAKATDPGGSGECSLQYRIRRADGVERWVEAHGRCTFRDGVPQRINGTLLDITERRQAEEAAREAARRKDEFLALLGHELRNPLAPIVTALELMATAHPQFASREREIVDRQVRHMIRLVDDLLDLPRLTRGTLTLRLEPLALVDAVEQAIEIAGPLFEARNHRLELALPPGLWVSIDPLRFTQLVSNLLTNAAKFTPPGGVVSVRARADGDDAVLEIQDTGIGIAPGDLGSIFEPFIQVARLDDQARNGLGLGLPLVRKLVQLHGGSVDVDSAGLGQGSTFTLRLPRLQSLVIEVPKAVAVAPRASVRRRVLIVDDNEDSAEMLGLLLEQFGHIVRVAHDGPRALLVAAEFEPQVAVLDIGLPVMDGYELAARLLERPSGAGLRLVALTGFGQDRDKERSRAAGFHHHLTKPIDARALEAALID
jgi:PAS domain S-box-containing protein